MTIWPKEKIPDDYLDFALHLVEKPFITKREFIDLCQRAIWLVDSGRTTPKSRAGMFFYITNLWFRYDHIDEGITGAIGDTFANWEIPGALDLGKDRDAQEWKRLKQKVAEADAHYPPPRISDYSEGVPAAFIRHANRLLLQRGVSVEAYVDLCQKATEIIEGPQTTTTVRRHIAFFLAEIAGHNPNLWVKEPLPTIITSFGRYELEDSFDFDLILERHAWQRLKLQISKAHKYADS